MHRATREVVPLREIMRDTDTHRVREGVPRERSLMGAMDKAKDKMQEVAGAAKEKVGDATDNPDLEAEGRREKAAGAVKGAGEKVKDAFD